MPPLPPPPNDVPGVITPPSSTHTMYITPLFSISHFYLVGLQYTAILNLVNIVQLNDCICFTTVSTAIDIIRVRTSIIK